MLLYKQYFEEIAGFETAGNIGRGISVLATKSGRKAVKRSGELRNQGKLYGDSQQRSDALKTDPEFQQHVKNIPKATMTAGKYAGQALYGGALAGAGYGAYKAYKKYKQKREDDKYLKSIVPKEDETVEESYISYLNN